MTFTVAGTRILITGAAMGMGRLYAERAVAEGAETIILWDINKEALSDTTKALRVHADNTQEIVPMLVDIGQRTAIEKAAANVMENHGGVDIIINNAGVVRGTYFWEHENERDTEFIMKINALAPMFITHEFLNGMISGKRPSRIVNIASAAGTLSNPKMSVYASSKWALIGWSDSVRLELKQQGHDNVKVTTVCPSYIATGMFEGVKGPLMTPIMQPEYVVNRVWHAMTAGKPMLMLPWTVHLSKVLKGILPQSWFDAIAGNIFGVYNTMDKFTGRK
ncbi:SDR family NAD(P)-dependent oxidoreductase [Aurantimicrobium photophilum]|uniref:3-oxoacyl-[acyl-carrier-protein] reductase FabG n=1 Tax=Aurantimicrobium photophilum TaxID=1987356 RepID=A0A2Z3S0D0_9MICO|nr:SDR family NAD(P)-dependent oxidoreductase [Aurantimicrobium photophilum]AWR22271.1 3-oxoacyl-[acyl-carrier-protein] reductase FabG [Aurantimicrobium photophilum]